MTLAEELKENLTEIAENMRKIYESGFSAGGLNLENGEGEGSLQQKGTFATAYASHAEGGSTHAEGITSHAEGNYAHAKGYASHAEGIGTRAEYEAQHVCGKFNKNKPSTLLEVGNGTNDEPSNAFEVLRDGRVRAYGVAQDPEDLVRKKEFEEALENLPSGGTVSISGKWRIHSTPTTTLTLENVSFISGSSRYYKVYFGRTSTGRTSIGYYRTDGVIQACSNGFWATDYYAFIEFEDTYNISKKDYEAFLTNATPISKVFDRWAQLPIADEETINLFAKNDALFDEAGIYAFKVETLGTFTLWAGTRIDRVRMLEGTVRVQKYTDEGITGVLSADFTYAHDTTGPHVISMIEIGNNGLSIKNTGATPWGIFYKVTKLA